MLNNQLEDQLEDNLALVNLDVFEKNLIFPDDITRIENSSLINDSDINKKRWCKMQFYLPQESCGYNNDGNSCKPDTTKLYNNNYFIIKKFLKDSTEATSISEAVTTRNLFFDKKGNIGKWNGTGSNNTGDMSYDEIIYTNPLIKNNTPKRVIVIKNGDIPDLFDENGKFIMSESSQYILYKDNESNYNLLYNPIHRKHFKDTYEQNIDLTSSRASTNGLDLTSSRASTNGLDLLFINYCHSTVTQNGDDYYFGDKHCNCFSPPTEHIRIRSEQSNNKFGTRPILASYITNENRAYWNYGFIRDVNRMGLEESGRNGLACANSLFCDILDGEGSPVNESFLTTFQKISNGSRSCNENRNTYITNICNAVINTGDHSDVNRNLIINKCSDKQECKEDCQLCGLVDDGRGGCKQETLNNNNRDSGNELDVNNNRDSGNELDVNNNRDSGNELDVDNEIDAALSAHASGNLGSHIDSTISRMESGDMGEVWYGKCETQGQLGYGKKYTGDYIISKFRIDNYDIVNTDKSQVLQYLESCTGKKDQVFDYYAYVPSYLMCQKNPDILTTDGDVFSTLNSCIGEKEIETLTILNTNTNKKKEKEEDNTVLIIIIITSIIVILSGGGLALYFFFLK